MTIYRATQILTFLVVGVGCQKNSDSLSSSTNLDSNSLSLSACQSDGASLSDSKIVGTENIVSDKKVLLGLDSNVNCAEAKAATWSISNKSLGKGSQIQATLKGTGIYYINVSAAPAASASQVSTKTAFKTMSATTAMVAVTDSKVLLVGPQLGIELNQYDFSLVLPTGKTLKSAAWNFNDGTPITYSLDTVSRSFAVGSHTFSVEMVDADNASTTLYHTITILPLGSGVDCSAASLGELDIVGPTQVSINKSTNYSLNRPVCLTSLISKISWSFSDSAVTLDTNEIQHTFTKAGDTKISVAVWLNTDVSPTFTITRDVNVVDDVIIDPGPETPVDPNSCLVEGSTRTIEGDLSNKDVACGTNGTKTNSYRDMIVQICQSNSNVLSWSEQSRSQVLVTEGQCQNQSCSINTNEGVKVIANGQSLTLYTTNSPVNTCASVQETRTCNNGVVSGSSNATYLTCKNGCGDFGVNGTVKVGIVTGEVKVPVTCAFQETGIFDTVNQIADQTCNDGIVTTSNNRNGDIKDKGICPVYSWAGTEQFSSCSADCGGVQTRQYECRDTKGVVVAANRCGVQPAAEQRACDGNPAAVRKTTVTTADEHAGSSAICPKNQIGVIVKDRTITTTVVMACINHSVQQESSTSVASAWVTTNYCRDFVAARCSQDSLSNTEAQGRYEWMVKCQNQVPQIKEFLTRFEDVDYKGISLNDSDRHLYATFLNSVNNKPWIAPIKKSGSCTVPATAYIAAVCVSSCATPEQEIMAQIQENKNLKGVSFVEALTKKLAIVGTLKANSSMNSTALDKTAVDQWVTELLDTTQPILTFNMKSGGQIKVTLNHPLLTQDGTMQLASEFKVNDSLVRLGGHKDTIVSIQKSDYYGKVYNLFVKSNDLKKNVVVIGGYLSGTAFYQNEGTQYMNRDLFRNNLVRGAFDK